MNIKPGANFNKETNCVDFKLASKNATSVVLCIFDEPIGKNPILNLDMKKNQDGIWETAVKIYALSNLKKPVYYAYRLFGPNWEREADYVPGSKIGFKSIIDENGNRFNPNKIAYDPCSKELSHLPSRTNCYRVNEENFMTDNSKFAPKSLFFPDIDEENRADFSRAFKDEIIGEVHIKDLSINEDMKERGTYLGAAKMAKKLKDFGFTMIEFLPVNEFDDENNHWGYMPLSYFALSKKYAYNKEPNSAVKEFRELIKAFHKEGLKVCMDVVYNHTGEARIYDNNINDANLMSYALIDNKSYYKLRNDKGYTDNSCCKNDFNSSSELGRNLILDSLEYFAKMGVDAFRFDLAVNLMDTNGGEVPVYDNKRGLISQIEEELEKRGIKVNSPDVSDCGINLIAEPWTCGGENCYQLGKFPPKWAEWNDIARGTIRANTLIKYETDPLGLRNLIEGCPFAFSDDNLSINYVSSHDGFSLNDINSYDKKTSADGNEYEMCNSFNGNLVAQENSIRKQIALLLLSKGTPMMGIGDIISHSKGGNNNSYDLDDETNYLDFSILNDKNSRGYKVYNFTKGMIEFRKKHPILNDCKRKNEYLQPNSQITKEDNSGYWQNKNSNFLGFKTPGDDVIYCGISKDKFEIEITLPENREGKKWYFVCDTTGENVYPEGIKYGIQNYTIKPNSLVLFIEK